ncbi:signal recognition particle-docking protein FtsY [Candidatus Woesearchaeota archaeon]|nr:signal recognition particle-docking protein FtsY [Candidatus Woesearchaeota archaeon]
MFNFLKDKLKKSIERFSEEVEQQGEEEEIQVEEKADEEDVAEEKKGDKKEKKGFLKRLFGKKEKDLEKEEVKEEKGVEKGELEDYEEADIEKEEDKEETEPPKEIFHDDKLEKELKKEYEEVIGEHAAKVVEEAAREVKKENKPKVEELLKKADEQVEERVVEKEQGKKPSASDLLKEVEIEDTEEEIKEEVSEIKKEISKVKKDILKGPKEVTSDVKERVDEIKKEIAVIKEDVTEIVEEKKREEKKQELKKEVDEVKEQVKEAVQQAKLLEPEEEKSTFLGRLTQKIITKRINEKQFEEMFWDLEVGLLENNVAVEVIEKIKNDLKELLVDRPIRRTKVADTIASSLRSSIVSLFDVKQVELVESVKKKRETEKKPFVVCFVGINGSGKTTTIGKIAHMLKEQGLKSVMAASDTFRAAAIQQLEEHANNVGVKLIKHDYGSDAAAVAFDAIKYAEAHEIDVVLIDTAGRMHSNVNLMDEVKKLIRVANPDLKIFVGESITGNDCVEQASKFNEAIGIDGIVLTKADVDEKGGAAISVSYVTKKPIMFLGTGQRYVDIEKFDSSVIIEGLGLKD